MGTVTFYQTANMANPYIWYGDVTSYSSTQITITDYAGNTGVYYGSFTYGVGGLSGGTVTGYDNYHNSVLDYTARGFSLPALTVNNYLQSGDALGLQQYALSGNDNIIGTAGNDWLNGWNGNDYLNGGAGTDTLVGGAGNDTYVVNIATDIVRELLGAGTDTIQSYVTYSLVDTDGAGANGGNVENLRLLGGAAINGTGNALNNILTGNDAGNILNGGAGTDTLNGGLGSDSLNGSLGNDNLTGGTGPDYFVFNTALNATTNKDLITDFSVVDDTIRLENGIMTGLGTTLGTLSAAKFWSGAGVVAAHDADDRMIYNTTTGALYYDADGTGAVAAIQIATIGSVTHAALTNADLVVF
jgi:Ca2+-binding RTX toxin-like protein